jgi:septal ring factor EnvC (AmiA/AmiB activator)
MKDEEMVNKIQKQKVEITRLRDEIAVIEDEIKNFPPNIEAKLEESKKTNKRQSEEVARLEESIIELNRREIDLQNQYKIYCAKYKVR